MLFDFVVVVVVLVLFVVGFIDFYLVGPGGNGFITATAAAC